MQNQLENKILNNKKYINEQFRVVVIFVKRL